VLPAGTAGVVTLTYQPESLYRVAVIGGFAALALCLGVALAAPMRRPRRPVPWSAVPVASDRPRWRDRSRWRRWPEAACAGACLAVAGLLIGGYPGALLLPAVTGALLLAARGRRALSAPRLIGGLFAGASVIGAVGQHLVFSGDTGPLVSAAANAVPQLGCVLVVGGLAAALRRPVRGQHPPPEQAQ
jgi:arabinofuranan 3-O-arabinosyltransferase